MEVVGWMYIRQCFMTNYAASLTHTWCLEWRMDSAIESLSTFGSCLLIHVTYIDRNMSIPINFPVILLNTLPTYLAKSRVGLPSQFCGSINYGNMFSTVYVSAEMWPILNITTSRTKFMCTNLPQKGIRGLFSLVREQVSVWETPVCDFGVVRILYQTTV